jgi:hypothetical protein
MKYGRIFLNEGNLGSGEGERKYQKTQDGVFLCLGGFS